MADYTDDPDPIDAQTYLDKLRPDPDASEAERLDVAIELRLASLPWTTIAERCGYTSADSARTTVTRALQSAALTLSTEFRREAIVVQYLRLEEWNRAVYPLIHSDDPRIMLSGVETALRIHDRVSRLLRLEEGEKSVGARDIVVPRKEDLADTLRQAVLERDGPDPTTKEHPADDPDT